jgi:predicted outer membrane protein
LLAYDESFHQITSEILLFSIKRLRATHADICARAMTISDLNSEEGITLQRLAEDTMPECMMPFMIYMLAHHPNFPSNVELSGEGDSSKMKNIVKSLKMVTNSLVSTLNTDQLAASSVSFMMKQVNVILQFYQDRNSDEVDNENLQLIAKTAAKVLQGYVKTAEYSQPFQGDVSLPMDLYAVNMSQSNEQIGKKKSQQPAKVTAASKKGPSSKAKGKETDLLMKNVREFDDRTIENIVNQAAKEVNISRTSVDSTAANKKRPLANHVNRNIIFIENNLINYLFCFLIFRMPTKDNQVLQKRP